jgi:hypothetical protein
MQIFLTAWAISSTCIVFTVVPFFSQARGTRAVELNLPLLQNYGGGEKDLSGKLLSTASENL